MKLIKRWRNNREIYLFTETLKEANSFLKVVRIYFFFILFSIFFFIDNRNHLDNLYYAVYCWTSWNSLLEPFIMVTYSLFCRSGILKYRSPMVILTSLLSVVNPCMYIKQMSMPPMHKVENEISCDNWWERNFGTRTTALYSALTQGWTNDISGRNTTLGLLSGKTVMSQSSFCLQNICLVEHGNKHRGRCECHR